MPYDHRKAYAQLAEQHRRERDILKNAGLCDERINELFEFDIQQLKRDRIFHIHLDLYIEPNDELFINDSEPDAELSWLDQMENQTLLQAIRELPHESQEIIRLHTIECLPLTFVAAFLDKPYGSVQRQYHRAIQKIKKFFSDV